MPLVLLALAVGCGTPEPTSPPPPEPAAPAATFAPNDAARASRIPVRVTLDTPTVAGALSADAIAGVVGRDRARLAFCWQKHLVANPETKEAEVSGTLGFDVAPAGTVGVSKVTAGVVPKAVGDCLRAVIVGRTFPTADGPTHVELPFTLRTD